MDESNFNVFPHIGILKSENFQNVPKMTFFLAMETLFFRDPGASNRDSFLLAEE